MEQVSMNDNLEMIIVFFYNFERNK